MYKCFNCGERLEYTHTAVNAVNADIYGKREIVDCDIYQCPACDTEYVAVPGPSGKFVNLLELSGGDSESEETP